VQKNLWWRAVTKICMYLMSRFYSNRENLMLAKYTFFTVFETEWSQSKPWLLNNNYITVPLRCLCTVLQHVTAVKTVQCEFFEKPNWFNSTVTTLFLTSSPCHFVQTFDTCLSCLSVFSKNACTRKLHYTAQ